MYGNTFATASLAAGAIITTVTGWTVAGWCILGIAVISAGLLTTRQLARKRQDDTT